MINIAEKLKNCPKGTKLYSPLDGEVYFKEVFDDGIGVYIFCNGGISYNTYGQVKNNQGTYSECLLFPSKDNRDWDTFQYEEYPLCVDDIKDLRVEECQEVDDKMRVLANLIHLRNAWWRIDGNYQPKWTEASDKYCIYCIRDTLHTEYLQNTNNTFAFRTAELRDRFLEQFRDMLEQVKELI